MSTEQHVVLNSNKWFSAVSDYSLQLSLYLKNRPGANVLYCAHEASPLHVRCLKKEIPSKIMSLLPQGPIRFIKAWRELSKIIRSCAENTGCVWVFEGREHTLCILHRIWHDVAWQKLRLVRVRGQAAALTDTWKNHWIYQQRTDALILCAGVIRARIHFSLNEKRTRVCLYSHGNCAGKLDELKLSETAQKNEISGLALLENAPELDFSRPIFLVVGRFDPVKGHKSLIDAFGVSKFSGLHQLVFIGKSQNITAQELVNYARMNWHGNLKACTNSRFCLESPDKSRRLFVIDEQYDGVSELMRKATFGVIPSTGSEVICRVAVEFLAHGTPLISSNIGALPEVLTGVPGLVYEAGRQSSFVEALEWASRKSEDKELMQEWSKKCTQAALERFSSDQYAHMVNWVMENIPPQRID